MRVGVIGAGGHSRSVHLPALAELRSVFALQLVGIADPRREIAEESAREFGFSRAYADSEALLDAGLDACLILTPTPTIPDLARRVAARGLACLIEKPFATSIEEAGQLVSELERLQSLIMVSANRRFDPAFTSAISWLGEVPAAAAAVMARSHRRERDFVYNTGVHLIDALSAACGPFAVTGRREQVIGDVSWVDATVDGVNGFHGLLSFAPTAGVHVEELRLMAAEDSVLVRFGTTEDSGCIRSRAGSTIAGVSTSHMSPWERDGTLAETVAFLEAVRSGGPSPVSMRSYLDSMRIAEQLNGPLAALSRT